MDKKKPLKSEGLLKKQIGLKRLTDSSQFYRIL